MDIGGLLPTSTLVPGHTTQELHDTGTGRMVECFQEILDRISSVGNTRR